MILNFKLLLCLLLTNRVDDGKSTVLQKICTSNKRVVKGVRKYNYTLVLNITLVLHFLLTISGVYEKPVDTTVKNQQHHNSKVRKKTNVTRKHPSLKNVQKHDHTLTMLTLLPFIQRVQV